MKISKVNHTKAAVGTGSNGVRGFLYRDPSQQNFREDLDKRFQILNSTAQKLYNIFNFPIIQRNDREYTDKRRDRDDIRNVNYAIKNALFKYIKDDNNYRKKKVMIEDDSVILRNLSSDAAPEVSDIDKCRERLCYLYLKKSLINERAECAEFLKALFHMDYDRDLAAKFLDSVRKDYEKGQQGIQIRKSIEHQNMVIQPDKQEHRLDISGQVSRITGEKITNADEKYGLRKFLIEYADLDEAERTDSLRRIRRLVRLYFYTPEQFSQDDPHLSLPDEVPTGSFSVYKDYEAGKQNKNRFVELPEELMSSEGFYHLKPDERKRQLQDVRYAVRQRNIVCYKFATLMSDRDEKDLFFPDRETNYYFIHLIEKSVERIMKEVYGRWIQANYRLTIGYLSERVWKDILDHLCMKYVAMGKAVYNYTFDSIDDIETDRASLDFGTLSEDILNGISSFDYEMIHANEKFQRETAVKVLTAVNNLAGQTVHLTDDAEDLLLLNEKSNKPEQKLSTYMISNGRGDTIRRILQFFGGASAWDTEHIAEAYKGSSYDADVAFLSDIKGILYNLRNQNFHFTTRNADSSEWNTELIGWMFEQDAEMTSSVEKKKFYTNNLPAFYKSDDLKDLIYTLYSEYVPHSSQIPGFNRVLVRRDFSRFVTGVLQIDLNAFEEDDAAKLVSALYFICKEIYYNGFLKDRKAAKSLFLDAWNKVKNSEENNPKATGDFDRRLKSLSEMDFDQICQAITSEYNAQNSGQMKKKTYRQNEKDPDIFRHYIVFLKQILMQAFEDYLSANQDKYGFLMHPVKCTMPSEEEFLKGYKVGTFSEFAAKVQKNTSLQEWYILGRLLSSKDLNALAGNVRSYIQYATDIRRRADETRMVLHIREYSISMMQEIAEVLALCIRTAGNISGNITDYFADEEDYAAYIKNYLDYDHDESADAIGIYMDGKNPILNRNIVMSRLFGPDRILSGAISKVTMDEIKEYREAERNISSYKTTGYPKDNSEQENILKYQRLKNRIEFRDIVEYGEIINELQGQLVDFSYLRERDLLYFQLGFHYCCLNNDSAKPAGYMTISDENGPQINGAILYQIYGMYINGISVYTSDKKSGYTRLKKTGKNLSAGAKIKAFIGYTQYLMNERPDIVRDGYGIYTAGLELFEDLHEHANIIDLRNYIDHFKYYTRTDRSILDLYSEVFDRFFTYDKRLQKNVMNIMENILLRHFVIAELKVGNNGTKTVGTGEYAKEKKCPDIEVQRLLSDSFTYKLDGDRKIVADARNGEFLRNVGQLLYYPHEADMSDRLGKNWSRDIIIQVKNDSRKRSYKSRH